VERIFSVFDVDGSGTVSLAEFMEALARFSGSHADSKIEFLFKVTTLGMTGHCGVLVPSNRWLAG
jgi:Ca2+-binding EF-hand superfamily protein